MNGRRLSELLRSARVPDAQEAEERSWEVVREAFARRERLPVRQRPLPRLGLALAGGLALIGVALSPAGAKVADLVDDVVQIGEEDARPALTRLPAAGELLVESSQGPWIVREDGSKRLLGDYEQATWSPNGLFVAVTAGHELTAVEPDGDVRWSIASGRRVSDARWAPSGFRIAYRSGDDLRVVAGDGTGDHMLARDVDSAAPAWRTIPDAKLDADPAAGSHVLAYARGRRIAIVDADSGRSLRRLSVSSEDSIRELEFSADGSRLLVRGAASLTLYDFGLNSREWAWRSDDRASAAKFSPDGESVGVTARASRGRSAVFAINAATGLRRQIFSGPGRFRDVAWSPDGRWLLASWHDADQWLFIERERRRRTTVVPGVFPRERPRSVVAVGDIRHQFAPGTSGAAPFPRIAGWVLPSR